MVSWSKPTFWRDAPLNTNPIQNAPRPLTLARSDIRVFVSTGSNVLSCSPNRIDKYLKHCSARVVLLLHQISLVTRSWSGWRVGKMIEAPNGSMHAALLNFGTCLNWKCLRFIALPRWFKDGSIGAWIVHSIGIMCLLCEGKQREGY